MQISAKEIAQMLEGTLEGDPETIITHPGKIEEGGEGALTFLANPKYESFAYSIPVSAILVDYQFTPSQALAAKTLIRVEDVYEAIAKLLAKFGETGKIEAIISKEAFVQESAKVEKSAFIGAFSIVEKGAVIGKNVCIHPQVFIGEDVEIGEGCILYPGVRVMNNCKIGKNCILHPNVVIGGDGFGFAPSEDGTYKKIPQIGNVIIEDDVEIGSNTTIDRATMGATVIRRGVKIDNLVMIAHNVEIGENTVIAAQAGFAGSSKIGKNCQIGGQAGFVGHIKIADGTKVQAQSGVAAPLLEENSAVYGSPAIAYSNYLRSYAVFKQLPELYRKINELEKKLNEK
ncbi:MAG: UDP-3-O-(3-hydroxymyristoyl)glucosamine N-acyltransferase [Bacteroidetes bacterium]|jgi:UDP-3-O-[3-hydroxymyristoyl] glucosamine N-acyltransferase|nr:UDP-3-O-(3-hydroxymyristoyl)glucosamine N-acyltransferase [Bacteroidota bacterium]MDF1864835.1 UDP-3-O-(3-hydroxymyristoyl)glucosamine N-acyltransferase [Saprospiraceae bacterium]